MTTEERTRVLWIEDRPKDVEDSAESLKSIGYQVEIESPGGDSNLEQKALETDILVLDLRWEKSKPNSRFSNGKTFAQRLATIRPSLPILFVSSFFADPEYSSIEREISPLATTERIDKAELSKGRFFARAKREALVNELEVKIRALDSESGRSEASRETHLPIIDEGSFCISRQNYSKLTPKERIEITRRAERSVRSRVDNVFAKTAVSWVVVGGDDGCIVKWGEGEPEPSDQDLFEMAHISGCMPFLFSRPVKIDSVNTTSSSEGGSQPPTSPGRGLSWASCDGARSYPTIGIDFPAGSHLGPTKMLFDTGAGANWVSYEMLQDRALISGAEIVRQKDRDIGVDPSLLDDASREALQIHYVDITTRTTMHDGRQSKTGDVRFNAVIDWNSSSFASKCIHGDCEGSVKAAENLTFYWCGMRTGLISGAALESLAVAIMLDGKTRTTLIVI